MRLHVLSMWDNVGGVFVLLCWSPSAHQWEQYVGEVFTGCLTLVLHQWDTQLDM